MVFKMQTPSLNSDFPVIIIIIVIRESSYKFWPLLQAWPPANRVPNIYFLHIPGHPRFKHSYVCKRHRESPSRTGPGDRCARTSALWWCHQHHVGVNVSVAPYVDVYGNCSVKSLIITYQHSMSSLHVITVSSVQITTYRNLQHGSTQN